MDFRKKQIPQSIDYFDELVKGNYYYVDKTLLVKDILENGSLVTLYARPRRFGKSMNLSMLADGKANFRLLETKPALFCVARGTKCLDHP